MPINHIAILGLEFHGSITSTKAAIRNWSNPTRKQKTLTGMYAARSFLSRTATIANRNALTSDTDTQSKVVLHASAFL
jgi:hypothetical protein